MGSLTVRGWGLVLAAALTAAFTGAFAQDDSRLQKGGVFIEPPSRVDPRYLPPARSPDTPDGPAFEDASHSPLQVRLALDVPLRGGGVVGFGSQGAHASSPTLAADLRYTPIADSPWFARLVFYRYLQAGEQQPWHPDYFYSFGYDDPRPGTWSLTYANYTGTRLRPDRSRGEGRFNFDEGLWSLAYRFDLPQALRPWLLVGDGDAALCRASLDLTPRFSDIASSTLRSNRTSATLGCRYTRPEGWFAEFTAYAYLTRGKQQPWDPDFTYSFGYSDWRPGSISIQYGNYSGNRWPGRARSPGEGTPRGGSITVSWRLDW